MIKRSFIALPCIILFLLVDVANITPTFATSASENNGLPLNVAHYRQVKACAQVARGFARCLAIKLQPTGPLPHTTPKIPSGLTPDVLQKAYKLPSKTGGGGQTIAIIDAQDDPNAETDMALYRSTFGLPVCTTANGCFKKVDQLGGIKYPDPDEGWAGEIALDLDMVSAICPGCHILLVEANSPSFEDLGVAVNTAAKMGAMVISNSYGGVEDAQSAKTIAQDYKHPGVTITASSGDDGYGVQMPAAFNSVIAVGGTSLSKAKNSRGWTEAAWNGSGSGCSQYVNKPSWQKDNTCHNRTVADVSAVADPGTGVATYNTYGDEGWNVYGGTSVSSPIIAGVYALAGNATKINPAAFLYSHHANLFDVNTGNNGQCKMRYQCTATTGYDGPTGLGTPDGTAAF